MIGWSIVICLRLQEEELDKRVKLNDLDTLGFEFDINKSEEDMVVEDFNRILCIDI